MKVKELVAKLLDCDPEADVEIAILNYEYRWKYLPLDMIFDPALPRDGEHVALHSKTRLNFESDSEDNGVH